MAFMLLPANNNLKIRREKEGGNVLFLILIVVALFAGLTYAVITTERNTSADISEEQADMSLSPLLQYASGLQFAIERLMIFKHCEETELSFHSDFWGHTDYEHIPPVKNQCLIFHAEGGGVVFRSSISRLDGEISFDTADLPQIGSAEPELLLVIRGLSRDFCEVINNRFGISVNPIPQEADTPGVRPFNGLYQTLATAPGKTADTAALRGRQMGCLYDTDDDLYLYYQVLLAR